MFKEVKEIAKFPTLSCFLLRCFSDLSLVQKVDKNRALSAADAHAKKQKFSDWLFSEGVPFWV